MREVLQNMDWFEKVNEDMVWGVENEQALENLEKLNEADSYEGYIIAEGDGHHVVFFEGVIDGEKYLMEASVSPDWEIFNMAPEKSMAGRVDNVFNFSEEWSDIYFTEDGPDIIN